MDITNIGIDLAKLVFQVHAVNAHGKVVLKKQLKRNQMAEYFVNLKPGMIGIEACQSAHSGLASFKALGIL